MDHTWAEVITSNLGETKLWRSRGRDSDCHTPNNPPPRTKAADVLQPGNKGTRQEAVDSYSDTWYLKTVSELFVAVYRNQVFTDRLREAEISRITGSFKTPSAY